jgi:hypothetical protein
MYHLVCGQQKLPATQPFFQSLQPNPATLSGQQQQFVSRAEL